MYDKFNEIIRIGKVSSIDEEKCTAQVTFEDRDNEVSGDMFVTTPFTMDDKSYHMPVVGERVRVLFDPNAPSKGCILGSYYADTRLPPIADKNKAYTLFKDGTLIDYDKKLHTLTINIPNAGDKSIDIITSSDVSLKTDGNVKVVCAKDVDVKCDGDMTLDIGGNLTIQCAGAIKLSGATIDLN